MSRLFSIVIIELTVLYQFNFLANTHELGARMLRHVGEDHGHLFFLCPQEPLTLPVSSRPLLGEMCHAYVYPSATAALRSGSVSIAARAISSVSLTVDRSIPVVQPVKIGHPYPRKLTSAPIPLVYASVIINQ